jgi:hypothetical protein
LPLAEAAMQPLSQEVPSTRTKNSRGVEPLHHPIMTHRMPINTNVHTLAMLLRLQLKGSEQNPPQMAPAGQCAVTKAARNTHPW